MINPNDLLDCVIQPALEKLQTYKDNTAELLLFTCAVETDGGSYLKQLNNGPALGIYQMEPNTCQDVWMNVVQPDNRWRLLMIGQFNATGLPAFDRLTYDLQYATAMARLHFARFPERIPAKDDIEALWEYYKKYWNTELGKAKKAESIAKYKKYRGIKDTPAKAKKETNLSQD